MEDEFSPKAQMALSALRDERPTDQARARVRDRVLAASVAVGAGTLVASGAQAATNVKAAASATAQVAGASVGASAAGGTLASLSGPKLALVLAGLGTLGAGAGVTMMARSGAEQARPEVAAQTAPPATRALPAPIVSTSPEVLAKEALREPEPTPATPTAVHPERARTQEPREPPARATARRTRRAREEPPASAQPAPESALRAESALLLQALALHEAGRVCQALALLDTHARKFGAHAGLAPERERMRKRFSEAGAATPSLPCYDKKGPLP